MLTHDELKVKALRNPHVQAEYNALEAEFTWFAELLQARNRAGLTQAEVAERMGTTPSGVARLEAGGGSHKHAPSIATLRKYAAAVGCTVEIKLIPCTQPAPAAVSVSQRKPRGRAGSGRGEQTKRTSSPQLRRTSKALTLAVSRARQPQRRRSVGCWVSAHRQR